MLSPLFNVSPDSASTLSKEKKQKLSAQPSHQQQGRFSLSQQTTPTTAITYDSSTINPSTNTHKKISWSTKRTTHAV